MSSDSADPRLHELIADYLARLEAGESPERAELLARHPDLADRLREFFADHDRMTRVAAPVRGPGAIERIRYVGDYELLEELGRGGMGVVYKARQCSLDRLVAVKLIQAGALATAEEVRRFRLEARAVAEFDHPHIVPIYEVGEWRAGDGSPPLHYFSMKLIEGGSLARDLGHFPKNPRAAAHLLATVAQAVHHAHGRHILHRDLKPANILLDASKRPHVTDFGLARRLDEPVGPSAEGAVIGTAAYMSPEQAAARSHHLSAASDVYSLGAVLYELLTGRPPFRGATPLETLVQVVDRDPPAPRRLNRAVPADLETIVLKCLDKRPHRRYTSAADLADDLHRWLEGKPIAARRVGRAEKAWLWARRRPVLAALGACVALLLVLLPIMLVAGGRQVEEAEGNLRDAAEAEEKGREAQARAEAERKRREDEAERIRREREGKEQALREERARERYLVYLQDMPRASQAWHAGEVRSARELLDRHIPPSGETDVRGWEWHHLDALCSGHVATLPAPASLRHLAFSPDGRRLALVEENEVRVVDVKTEKVVWAEAGSASRIVWSPDGRALATLPEPGGGLTSYLRDAATGKALLSWKCQFMGSDPVAWRPDGERVAVVADGALILVCDAAGKELLRLPGGGGVAWSPDGKRLAVGAAIVDPETGKELLRLQARGGGVAWSADGKRLAVVDAVCDAASGRKLATLHGMLADDRARQPAWSGDGRRVVAPVPHGAAAEAWDADSGRALELPRLEGQRCWSRDGRFLAIAWHMGRLILWDAASGQQTTHPWSPVREQSPPVRAMAWSADGTQLAVASGTVQVWDLRRARPALRTGPIGTAASLAWDAAGREVRYVLEVHGQGMMAVAWEPAAGRPVLIDERVHPFRPVPFSTAAWSPDGRTVATAQAGGGMIHLWDATTGRRVRSLRGELQSRFVWLSWSPDGRRLAALAEHGSLGVWDATGGEPLVLANIGSPRRDAAPAAWSPDGTRLAFGPIGEAAHVWDAATGRQLHVLPLPRVGGGGGPQVLPLAFSPDGKRLAARDDRTRQVLVWDLDQLRRPVRPALALDPQSNPHTWTPGSLAWAPDGRRLAVCDPEGVRVWDLATRQAILLVQGQRSVVGWSPDGKSLAMTDPHRILDRGEEPERLVVREGQTGKEIHSQLGGHGRVVWEPGGPRLLTLVPPKDSPGDLVARSAGRDVALGTKAPPVPSEGDSPDGRLRVGWTDREGTVVERACGKVVSRFSLEKSSPRGIAWAPDGRRLAVLEHYSDVGLVVDAATGKRLARLEGVGKSDGTPRTVGLDLQWAPDGRGLVTVWPRGDSPSDGADLHCWDPATGKRLYTRGLDRQTPRRLAWSPDRRWLAVAAGERILVLEPDTGREQATFVAAPGDVANLAWSPDSTRLASQSGTAGEVYLVWSLDSSRPLCQLLPGFGPLAWSPDGNRLAGTFIVWEGPAAPVHGAQGR